MTRTLPSPPVALRKPKTTQIHNTELHDDYGWLRDKGAPEVTAYLEAGARGQSDPGSID